MTDDLIFGPQQMFGQFTGSPTRLVPKGTTTKLVIHVLAQRDEPHGTKIRLTELPTQELADHFVTKFCLPCCILSPPRGGSSENLSGVVKKKHNPYICTMETSFRAHPQSLFFVGRSNVILNSLSFCRGKDPRIQTQCSPWTSARWWKLPPQWWPS